MSLAIMRLRTAGAWRPAFVLLPVNLFLMLLVAVSPIIAQDNRVASIRFVVHADASLLSPSAKASADADDRNFEPYIGALVYIPPSGSPALKKRAEAREWLLACRDAPDPKQHQFKMVDEQLSPAVVIARVGDAVDLALDRQTPIRLEMLNHSPLGFTRSDAKYTFTVCEPIPFQVSVPTRDRLLAHMLVLDHGYSAVTDAEGIARLNRLPLGIEIPMRLLAPGIRQKYRFECETLEIRHNGTFVLQVTESQGHTHTIRLRRAAGSDDLN